MISEHLLGTKELALTIPSPPASQHKLRFTYRKQQGTDTCYLTCKKCVPPTISTEHMPTPSLLISALGFRQFLLKLLEPYPAATSVQLTVAPTKICGIGLGLPAQ